MKLYLWDKQSPNSSKPRQKHIVATYGGSHCSLMLHNVRFGRVTRPASLRYRGLGFRMVVLSNDKEGVHEKKNRRVSARREEVGQRKCSSEGGSE